MKLFALATAATLGATVISSPAQAQAHSQEIWTSAYVAFGIGYCMNEQGYWTQERASEVAVEYLRDFKRYPRQEILRVLQDEALPHAAADFVEEEGGCPAVTAKFMQNAQDAENTIRRGTLSDTPFRF